MNHYSSHYALFCFCFCFFLFLFLHAAANNNSSHSSLSAETKFVLNLEAVDFLENIEKNTINIVENGDEGVRERSRGARRLLLGGPGSSPPRCASKCGGCMPCKPVHVPVPPGTRVTTEYYPEAWRCKCGNKLYMP